MRRSMTAAVLLTILLANGCGSLVLRTFCAKQGASGFFESPPYGATMLEGAVGGIGTLTGQVSCVIFLLDLPLTFSLDTLFLPFDLMHTRFEKPPEKRPTPAVVATTHREDDSDDANVERKEVVAPPTEELRSGEARSGR